MFELGTVYQVIYHFFKIGMGLRLMGHCRTNTSIYTALTDPSLPDRGWVPYFDQWKANWITNRKNSHYGCSLDSKSGFQLFLQDIF
jgi:hypothetical protein